MKTRPQSSLRDRGFTLLESLFALALFAGAAVALFGAFVNALLLRERGESRLSFESDLRAVRLQLLLEPDLERIEDGGTYETVEMGTAEWTALVEPTNVIDLFQVQFSVEFPDAKDEQPRTHLETFYLLRPTWSESDERSALLEDKKQALLDSRDF